MPIHEFEVRFDYDAEVVREGRRKVETARYSSSTWVSVAVVDPVDAPVAFGPSEPDTHDLEVHRWFDGALWVPDRSGHASGEPDDQRDLAWLVERYSWNCGLRAIETDRDVRKVVSDDRLACEARIRDGMRHHLVVDGMLWARAEEPVLFLQGVGRDRWCKVGVVTSPGEHCFRLDQLDWVRECSGYEGRLPRVEVRMPETLALDIAPRALSSVASDFAAVMGRCVAEQGPAYFAAYHGLRDVARKAKEAVAKGAGYDVAALASALRAARDAAPEHPRRDLRSLQDADGVLRRLEMAELDADHEQLADLSL